MIPPKPRPISELELQLWLANQLPEEIAITRLDNETRFIWKNEPSAQFIYVTPREWDYIVRRVEDKLTPTQKSRYIGAANHSYFGCIFMDWKTRATALMKVNP